MAIQFSFRNMNNAGGCGEATCLDKFGCPSDRCPDFIIRRHDTQPPFKVLLEDCNGPMDIQGLVIEVNMWAKGRLKKSIAEDCEYFTLADNIGFEQMMVGDIIIMERVRSPEYMLVLGFDECNHLVYVQRGYRNTSPQKWKKGTNLRIFRTMNAPAQTEMVYEDIEKPDGTVEKDVLSEAFMVYEWHPEDTCLPGCYWMEFKVLKMKGLVLYLPGGYWTGPVHQKTDGTFHTGSVHTDSSVNLFYNSVEDRYFLPTDHWTGATHLHSGSYFTGSIHDDGSVFLDRTDKPSGQDAAYSSPVSNEVSMGIILEEPQESSWSFPTTVIPVCPSGVADSCEISFTDPNLSPRDFGCILGDGVEWARRFPTQAEGFLIKIADSYSAELP